MRRFLVVALPVVVCLASFALAEDDTAKAAATRKLLKEKVSVEYKDEALRDVLDNLRQQVGEKKLFFKPDTTSGVQLNTKITLSKKDAPLAEVLNALCEKNGWGYYIISSGKNAYDGQVVLKVGKERGYEEGKEPAGKDDKEAKAKTKGKDKAKDKKEAKGKTEPEEKTEPKEKAEPKERPADDEERAERAATLKLKTAKELIDEDKKDRAKQVLEDLLKKYPKSKAADEAKELLEKLKD